MPHTSLPAQHSKPHPPPAACGLTRTCSRQLHSICFSLRSCAAMLLVWAGLYKWRGVAVLAAHLAADEATRRYGQGVGTMRDMPWPPGYSKEFIARINYFYSTSQLCAPPAPSPLSPWATPPLLSFEDRHLCRARRLAIIGCLCLAMDEAYVILLPIQIAAFLFTLVRKVMLLPIQIADPDRSSSVKGRPSSSPSSARHARRLSLSCGSCRGGPYMGRVEGMGKKSVLW